PQARAFRDRRAAGRGARAHRRGRRPAGGERGAVEVPAALCHARPGACGAQAACRQRRARRGAGEALMPFTITFLTNEQRVVSVAEKANLLRTSIREKGGIPFKCGAGICGTCKCKIEKGLENT